MNDPVMENIKQYAITQLKANYRYCGVAESDDRVVINSTNEKGYDVKIKLSIDKEG